MRNFLFIFTFLIVSLSNAQTGDIYLNSNNYPKKVLKKLDVSTIIKPEFLDSKATFIKNESDFRNDLLKNLDMGVLGDAKGEFWAIIYFLVDEKGKIAQFVADGNHNGFVREAEYMFSKIKDSYTLKPAIYKGNPVKMLLNIPLGMKIE